MTGAIITAAGAILVASLTWFFSRFRDREALQRATKLKYYEEFVEALSGTVGIHAGLEEKKRWARSCNTLHLIASPEVLAALHAFQDISRLAAQDVEVAGHDVALTNLMSAIRADLGFRRRDNDADFSVRMWSAPLK